MNKLPNIFKGTAPKSTNQTSSIIKGEVKEIKKEDKTINKQIHDIFSSDNYIYKADTVITLNNGEVLKKTIIGKTNDSLITLDDELIEVKSISKIELS